MNPAVLVLPAILALIGCAPGDDATADASAAASDYNTRFCAKVWQCKQECPTCDIATNIGTDEASCLIERAKNKLHTMASCGVLIDVDVQNSCLAALEALSCTQLETWGCPGRLVYNHAMMSTSQGCYCARLAASSSETGPCPDRPICGQNVCAAGGGVGCGGDESYCRSFEERVNMAEAATRAIESECKPYIDTDCAVTAPMATPVSDCRPDAVPCDDDSDCTGAGQDCNLAASPPTCQTLYCGANGTECSKDSFCASQTCSASRCN